MSVTEGSKSSLMSQPDELAALERAAKLLHAVRESARERTAGRPLDDVADDYETDATAAERRSIALIGLSLLVAAVPLGLPLVMSATYRGAHNTQAVSIIVSSIALALLALGLLALAYRYRRVAAEATRLSHLLKAVARLTEETNDTDVFIRVALLQRLFPRSIDDHDPLSEPEWLTGADIRAMWEEMMRGHHQSV